MYQTTKTESFATGIQHVEEQNGGHILSGLNSSCDVLPDFKFKQDGNFTE